MEYHCTTSNRFRQSEMSKNYHHFCRLCKDGFCFLCKKAMQFFCTVSPNLSLRGFEEAVAISGKQVYKPTKIHGGQLPGDYFVGCAFSADDVRGCGCRGRPPGRPGLRSKRPSKMVPNVGCLHTGRRGRRPLRTMFVGTVVGDGLPDVPVCEANNHRRWFRIAGACRHLIRPFGPPSPQGEGFGAEREKTSLAAGFWFNIRGRGL